MKVSEAAITDVVFVEEDEPVSKILSKMQDSGVHQLPVLRGDSPLGMVFLKDIMRFSHDNLASRAKDFVTKLPSVESDEQLADAVTMLVNLGVRALPVVEGESIYGIISETDAIKHVDYVSDVELSDIMSKPVRVGQAESLAKVMSLMGENNISRLPVVDSDGSLVGVIDSLSMIRFLLEPKKEAGRINLALEKKDLSGFTVKDYMRSASSLEWDKFSLKKVIGILQSSEEVFIVKEGKPIGVVTPRDVLELSVVSDHIPVQVSHFHGILTEDLAEELDSMLKHFTDKNSKMFDIDGFFVYVDAHSIEGRRKYSLRTRLLTDKGLFVAKSFGWTIAEATHDLLSNLQTQMMKAHDKALPKRKLKDI